MAHTIRDKAEDLQDTGSKTSEIEIKPRPAPTPDQAAFGIRPPAVGNGTFQDIMRGVRSRPRLGDKEFEAFYQTIAEDRAARRKLARDRSE